MRRALIILLVLVATAPAFGANEPRFPPPEFTTHKMPDVVVAPAPPDAYEYLDLAVLVGALALATYLALGLRRRRAMFLLAIFSLAYFGFWRGGCVCPIGAIQNVARALFDSGYVLPWTVIAIFLLPLIATLLFGRAFCAAVCPLGAIQDLVLVRAVKVPSWINAALRLAAYLYLGAAVLFAATGSAFLICQYDPFVALFRLSGSFNMIVLGLCFLVIGAFVGRPYCRWLCPYGVLLSWTSFLSWRHVTITPDECIRCRLCEDSCPVGAIRAADADHPPPPRTEGKRRLAALLLLLPVLVAGGGAIGWGAGHWMARLDTTVHLADRIDLEEKGEVKDLTIASEAFRTTGQPIDELKSTADQKERSIERGAILLGAFLGLVIGLKLLGLSVRRRRENFEADRATCVACGRCFEFCPIEKKRRGQVAAPGEGGTA
jgi:NosR/NirI family transcriptional regulator, nitrous oxide reductase regulator